METYKIEPGKSVSLHIKDGFFSAQAMVSIKALGVESAQRARFDVKFLNANGNSVGFPILLEAPYFFDAGRTFSGTELINEPSSGPFYFVEITSAIQNPSLVIQVGFTNRLA